MILNESNYYSVEANREYLSASQYHDFVGSLGNKGCEARALAKIKGEWVDDPTTPMLVGSYIDAHFSGSLDVFKSQHPELLKKDGGLKSDFINAIDVIHRIERDQYFLKYLQGEKQVIFTGELFGAMWKTKIDCINRELFITDLKIMADLRKAFWVKDFGVANFIEYWGIVEQVAIYQKIAEINIRKKLPVFIAAASKESEPDIEIIGFPQGDLDDVLSLVGPNIPRILSIKSGRENPERCGCCDYCRKTKVITGPINYRELINE